MYDFKDGVPAMDRRAFTGQLVSLALLASGCGKGQSAADPAVAEQRKRYLLAEEPADPVGVLELREDLLADREVVVLGKIGGVENPWTAGRASFIIADPALAAAADEHDHGHKCSEDCPFCSKRTKSTDALALVELVDEQGRPVPIDARELLGVATDQVVVVRGRARVDKLGCLVVSASGCYIRR